MGVAIGVAVLLGGAVVLASQLGWFAGGPTSLSAAPSDAPAKRADPKVTCKKAADRYEQCVGELMGAEAKAMVSTKEKDGTAQCADDDKTVAMYEECLPSGTCRAFMDCMMDYAQKTLSR